MKELCQKRIEECYQVAENYFCREFDRPSIEFSRRMTSCAGKAFLGENKIRLSEPLLLENGMNFVSRTPAHEAAHLIAYRVFGDRGHGTGWKCIMHLLGQEASRCHSYEVAGGEKYISDCGKEMSLSKIRHNKLQSGKVEYYYFKKSNVRLYSRNHVK